MSEEIKNVTVLMAAFNDSRYLSGSIKSILNQTFSEFEFLIIDDGSDDDTEEIVNGFKDTRIKYKRISHRGLAGALNFGLINSEFDWIARIDADDLNTTNRLKTQVDFLNEHRETDVLASWSAYFNESGKILFSLKTPHSKKKINESLNLHNPINHSSVIFNKRKILDEGGYNADFKSFEDFELWFRLREKLNYRILPEILVYTRFRKDSLIKTGSREQIYELLNQNAKSRLEISSTSKEQKYWSNILFWVEFFYGSKNKSRDYFLPDITLKKSLAYLNSFLPENEFKKLIELRIRHRITSQFRNKKALKEELKSLLK